MLQIVKRGKRGSGSTNRTAKDTETSKQCLGSGFLFSSQSHNLATLCLCFISELYLLPTIYREMLGSILLPILVVFYLVLWSAAQFWLTLFYLLIWSTFQFWLIQWEGWDMTRTEEFVSHVDLEIIAWFQRRRRRREIQEYLEPFNDPWP